MLFKVVKESVTGKTLIGTRHDLVVINVVIYCDSTCIHVYAVCRTGCIILQQLEGVNQVSVLLNKSVLKGCLL